MDLKERAREIQNEIEQNIRELERKIQPKTSKIVAEEIRGELQRINRISSGNAGDTGTVERPKTKSKQNTCELERKIEQRASKIAEEIREELERINRISGVFVDTRTAERLRCKIEVEREVPKPKTSKIVAEEVREELLRINEISSGNAVTTRSRCANLIDFMKDEVNKIPSVSNRKGDALEETECILSKTDFHSQYENKPSNNNRHDRDENVTILKASSKSVSTNIATENISKPQKITLKIFHGGKITDIDAFLQQRIGKALKYQIHHIDLSTENSTDVVIEFPSKTARRNAEYLLQGSNGKEGIKVSFCHFHEKSENTKNWTHNNDLQDAKTKSEYSLESSKVKHEEKTSENVKLQNQRTKDVQIKLQPKNLRDQGDQAKSIASKTKITNLNSKPSNKDNVSKKEFGNGSSIGAEEFQQKDKQKEETMTLNNEASKTPSNISGERNESKVDGNKQNNLNEDIHNPPLVKKDENTACLAKDFDISSKITKESTDSPKPQKLVLEILHCGSISNFETFLKNRLGKEIKFKVHDIKQVVDKAELVVEFASKSGSRKAVDILHAGNGGQTRKVWCYFYKDKRPTKVNSSNTHIKDSKDKTKSNVAEIPTKLENSKGEPSNAQKVGKTNANDSTKIKVENVKKTAESCKIPSRNKKQSLESFIKSGRENESKEQTDKSTEQEVHLELELCSKFVATEREAKKESERFKTDFETRLEMEIENKPLIDGDLKVPTYNDKDEKQPDNIKTDEHVVQIQHQHEPTSKCKPQILEIEIIDLDKKESNYKLFLLQRLKTHMQFEIKDVDIVQNTTFLSLEFPTTKSSKQAKQALQKSNTTSKTKIVCHFDKERKLKMKSQRLSKLVNSFASDTEKLLIKHNKELVEISTQISKIEGGHKKQKFCAVEDFERKKKEKEALNSKKIEMENHKIEFKSFLTSLYHNLTNMKDTEYNEGDLTQLETAFKVECERFSAKLPIYARRTDIVKIVDNNQTSVILGETGSGKSTQVIQYLFQTGRFAEGTIVCTQPRKVAAISLATRVAQELAGKVGHIVGYQVGLHMKKSKETKILYVTDHVLLNECLKDPLLTAYSCVIIDEAHERSIFTDLLLGMIKKCLVLRPELRVIITSATIDPDVFVNFFGGQCPVLSVSGRAFPVDITWSEEDCGDDDYEQKTLEKALQVHETEGQGDILAFLTSPVEVEKSCQRFENRLRNRKDFICLPLHGKLQANEQQRVFIAPPRGKRKIVFATNSAETSITIPGIKYVIDSGRIKEMQFDPKKNISSLVVTLVTKSSANQRSGRAGRTTPGKCFRLYSKEEYDKMNSCSSPEILRVNLGQALLKLIELGVDPISFDFVESPPKDQLTMAMDTLESIGAVCNGVITELGKWIAKLPFQPIFGVLVHDALEFKVGIEALVLTACCGSGGSLFYRSGSSEEKQNSDKMKIRFSHEGGDLMTMLNAYREWHKQPEKSKGKWCAQNYVNGKTIKAVRDTVTEVLEIIRKELKIKLEFKFNDPGSVDIMLQKMLFKTFKHNICHFLGHEKAGYHVIHKAHNVCLFPSSALPSLGLQPEWIVIEQILQINRDYGVNATPIPIEWIDEGIKEGWLKEFGMEKAEQQKVKQILMYGLGDQSFRDFVGPRYVRLKELENTLQKTFSDSIVIVDTDSKASEICVYGSIATLPGVKQQLNIIVEPIKAKFKDEKSEQYLSSTKQGTRAIMSAGCNVADVLMPDEYKSVMVISDQFTTSQLTDDDVRQEFEKYGNVSQVEQFHYTKNKKNWGRVTFETSEEAEYAVEQSREETIIGRPTGNARLQNEHRFRAKLEWCRRPSKCCGFVEFSGERFVGYILRNNSVMLIGGTEARLARGKNNDSQIFVSKLNKFVNEEVLRNSFLDRFGLGDNDIARVSIIRHRINTSRMEIDTIERRLHAHLSHCVKDGRYTVQVKPPKPQDFTFLAFASFSKIEEGENACRYITENFRPDEEIITATVSLQSSLLVIRSINNHCGDLILKTINSLNKQEGTDIRHKLYPNGNCAIDINCDHIDTLHRVRRKLEKIIQGRKMTKQEFPNIHELFSRAGKYELRNIATASGVFILDDYRILEISIYGEKDKQEQAFSSLQDYLRKLSLGTTKTFSLRGPDKPFGILKQMFIRFGIDLGKLKKDIKGLNNLQIDLRHHTVSINGTPNAVEKTFEEIDKIIEDLRGNQNYDHIENEERQCAICLMEIEEGEIYRLEACGHPFCKTCILPQLESAVGNNDFPISCCKEDCEELWAWRDLTKVALQSGMSVNNLVNKAVNCFVAKHDKEYKFCISPDCPSIYRVTRKSDVFCCCECEARICTACHTQYHDGFTCDMVQELEEDPSGLRIWMRKDPKNRKLCPSCDLPIEKAGGCDHMQCSKCKRHICWVCLEHFPSSGDCYGHLRRKHGGFGGGYGGYL